MPHRGCDHTYASGLASDAQTNQAAVEPDMSARPRPTTPTTGSSSTVPMPCPTGQGLPAHSTPKGPGHSPSSHEASTVQVTPESVRPLPKAADRQAKKQGGRKKLSSVILTLTPVKEGLRSEQNARRLKANTRPPRPRPTVAKQRKTKTGQRNKNGKKTKCAQPSSSDNEDDNSEIDVADLCDDDSNDEMDESPVGLGVIKAVKRQLGSNSTSSDNCSVCGELGRNNELWYRCRVCSFWAHSACTGAICAAKYVCDCCEEDQHQQLSRPRLGLCLGPTKN